MTLISPNQKKFKVVIAGATGNLGFRIACSLREHGVFVHALVRTGSASEKKSALSQIAASVQEVDFSNHDELAGALSGATCVVSALSGLSESIHGAQGRLLRAAVAAGVPRFIPSDYSIDFTKIPEGANRNLNLRKDFQAQLDVSSISATSILNGAFTDMLTGQAPIILFGFKRVLYWGSANQKMDFTSIDDVARFTARVAIDPSSPRYLRVAGDQMSARELSVLLTDLTGTQYKLTYAGGLSLLHFLIKIARAFSRGRQELYPPWQGMQYLHNMYSGIAKFNAVDNDRYPEMKWTKAKDILADFLRSSK